VKRPARTRARLLHDLATRGAVVAWAAVIFSLSTLQGSQVPGRFGPLGHFGEYAILAALTVVAARPRRGVLAAAIVAIAVACGYAATDELHQAFVPSRMPDAIDWLVDSAGALTGATLAALVYMRSAETGPERERDQ
jgi:VanZ family protein